MSYLVVLLLVAGGFIALLLWWSLRGKSTDVEERREIEKLIGGELLPSSPAVVERVFSRRDLEFVSGINRPEVQRLFHRERTRLALLWIMHARTQAACLMKFHRRTARRYVQLEPLLEIRLMANYLAFCILYAVLNSTIRLAGPFRARRLPGYAFSLANKIRIVAELDLAALDREQIRSAWINWSA